MFHPEDNPMERGWVGRVDGDRVLHLAAQTLQAFFLGGGGAREHAEYRLDEVKLLVPVLQPPNLRVFESASSGGEGRFRFGNATAVVGDGALVEADGRALSAVARLVAVVGAGEAIGGFSALLEWVSDAPPPKDSDFAVLVGPLVVTPDELDPSLASCTIGWNGATAATGGPAAFDWEEARSLAARGTHLRPGDLIAGPPLAVLAGVARGAVRLDLGGVGTLSCRVG